MARKLDIPEGVPLHVGTYSPGDGVTRYRFFSEPSGYFGPKSGIFTALGYKEADAFVMGYCHGYGKGKGG